MSYVLAFIGLILLIVLHEGGHFRRGEGRRHCRSSGFALFFGPLIVKRRIGETEYGIGTNPTRRLRPDRRHGPGERKPAEGPGLDRGYYSQPVWKRIVAIAAGAGR